MYIRACAEDELKDELNNRVDPTPRIVYMYVFLCGAKAIKTAPL